MLFHSVGSGLGHRRRVYLELHLDCRFYIPGHSHVLSRKYNYYSCRLVLAYFLLLPCGNVFVKVSHPCSRSLSRLRPCNTRFNSRGCYSGGRTPLFQWSASRQESVIILDWWRFFVSLVLHFQSADIAWWVITGLCKWFFPNRWPTCFQTIIEVDGTNVEPLVVDSIQIFVGQCYSLSWLPTVALWPSLADSIQPSWVIIFVNSYLREVQQWMSI